jgi:hypothetical protein
MFKRHPVYFFIHVLFGLVGYFYPSVLFSAIGYQVFQLIFNVRVFPFEAKIESGNSLKHTGTKLGEIALGYGLAMLYKALSKA